MTKKTAGLSDICSTREASEMLDVSQRTVQLWVESGVLNAWKSPGGHRKITRVSINKMLEERADAIRIDDGESTNHEFCILYVEDDEAQQTLFSNLIARSKHKITLQLATNGFDGLISLGTTKPDLLITDLKMPGMDGFEMVNHLQKNPAFSHIKIIVFTSMSEQEITDHGGLPSKIQVITKPVPLSHIGLLVDSLVLAEYNN
jgi:excisionase family DNA binding protein